MPTPNRQPVAAAIEPKDLLELDLTRLPDAPARIEESTLVESESGNYCRVIGYVVPTVRFELRWPMAIWNRRFLFVAPGGYAGPCFVRPLARGRPPRRRCGALPVNPTEERG